MPRKSKILGRPTRAITQPKPSPAGRKVPPDEKWLIDSPTALARVRRGIAEAGERKASYLGSFGKFARSRKRSLRTTPKEQQRRRLEEGIRNRIRHFQRCLKLIGNVDAAVFKAGMEFFTSEFALTQWLCEPARSLGDKIPLVVMRTAKGRAQVAGVLRAIAQGNYL